MAIGLENNNDVYIYKQMLLFSLCNVHICGWTHGVRYVVVAAAAVAAAAAAAVKLFSFLL